jgi:transporter family protein
MLLSLLAIAAFGTVGLLQKLNAALMDPTAILFWVIVGLCAGSLPLLGWTGAAPALHAGGGILLLGLASGASNALGSWLLFRALRRGAPAAIAIPLTALYPLVTIALALAFLGEQLSTRQWLGALLAIGGGALMSLERPAVAPAAGTAGHG